MFLRDTDERACAYIAGAAPNRWGFTSDGRDLNTLIEPVPPSLSGLFCVDELRTVGRYRSIYQFDLSHNTTIKIYAKNQEALGNKCLNV